MPNKTAHHIDLKEYLQDEHLERYVQESLPGTFGRNIYDELGSHGLFEDIEPISLLVPEKWLQFRWDELHDGYQYLALQHPLSVSVETQTPIRPVERGPLRVLHTTSTQGGLDPSDHLLVEAFAERFNRLPRDHPNPLVDLVIEHEVSTRQLRQRIHSAKVDREAFHLWHHTGEVRFTDEGPVLQLRDKELKFSMLQTLVSSLEDRGASALQVFLLHSPTPAPLILSAFARLSVPAAIGLTYSPESELLLNGLYRRLLSHDVATTIFLARLDSYIKHPKEKSWASLQLLTAGLPSKLVTEEWQAQWSAVPTNHDIQRFLFVRANPMDLNQSMLPLDAEIKQIKEALVLRRNDKTVTIRDEGALEVEELSRYLLEDRPHLLHFSGHGTRRGTLLFETRDNYRVHVSLEAIASRLAMESQLRCVVLNACHGAPLAEVLRSSGIIVISMSDDVTDSSAVHFARGFYQALAHGETVARAFDLAREEVGIGGALDEKQIPQISDYERAKQIQFFETERM